MTEPERLPVHVLISWSEEDQAWLAHCLDFDLLGHGDTQDEAMACLQDAMETYIDYNRKHGLAIVRPAPHHYWEQYWAAFHKKAEEKLKSSGGEAIQTALALAG